MNFSRFLEARRGGATLEAAMDTQVFWKGGSNKSSSSTVSTPTQSGQYDNLLNESDKWLEGGGFDKNYGGSPDFNPVAGFTDAQNQGMAGMAGTGQNLSSIYNGAGADSIGRYLGAYDPNNTGLTAAMDAANNQANFNFETQQMGNIRQGANDSGQFGSSRAGIAEGLARGQLAQGIQNTNAQMAYADQQSYNQNQLSALNNLTSITQGLASGDALQYDAGNLQQQQNQKEIMGQLDKWAYENNVELNDLLAYKQLVSGDMGGTNVTNSKGPSGGGSGWQSMLGGMGGSMMGSMGNSMGSGIMGMFGA